MNPADCLTRGVKLVEIMNLKLWWEGPEYLKGKRIIMAKEYCRKRSFKCIKRSKDKKFRFK